MFYYIFEARFMFYKEKKKYGETLLQNKLIIYKKDYDRTLTDEKTLL